ncbi:MAG: hypothetical protein ACYDDF_13860 [Thermoplasmatota archaeon]
MLTRTCVHCGEAKTIRGVWYVWQETGAHPPSFICESCYLRDALVAAA